MAIGAIESSGTSTALQGASLGQQDFMKILLTQLMYQDPLKPMDNQQFMAQMAQFTALQQTTELNTNMTQLIRNHAALQSVGLIGRSVDIETASGIATGDVTALNFNGSLPVMSLTLDSGESVSGISLSKLVKVR